MKDNFIASVFDIWKKNGLVLLLLDILIILGAFMLSYYIRFYHQTLTIKTVPMVSASFYLKASLLLVLVWVYFIWKNNGYKNDMLNISSPLLMIRAVVVSGIYAFTVLMVVSFMLRAPLLLSRQVCLMSSVIGGVAMLVARLFFFPKISSMLAENGCYIRKMAMIGMNDVSHDLINDIKAVDASTQFLGLMGNNNCSQMPVGKDIPYLGAVCDIHRIHRATEFNVLIIADSENGKNNNTLFTDKNELIDIINYCELKNISLYVLSDSYSVLITQDEVGSFAGHPIACLRDAVLHPGYAVVKRLIDTIVATIGVFLGMPLWIGIALIIWIADRGPVFYTQIRSGYNGKPFKMYKFRSMVVDAEERLKSLIDVDNLDEPVFKIKNDPRVTHIGKFLRRTSLDEIPQLINVLKGEMSLVGPRPEELSIVEKYDAYQRRRLKAKPGITGYQQVMNRGEALLSKRIRYDLIYLKNQSLLMDLYILGITVFVVLSWDDENI
ncbi:sugar transferase [Desulfococcaceae bacterium HSG9]|nr:sugar transferase [Desulfococcaceae bacterium HSG9]